MIISSMKMEPQKNAKVFVQEKHYIPCPKRHFAMYPLLWGLESSSEFLHTPPSKGPAEVIQVIWREG